MLAAAYRGYEYQDLLVALRLVDVLLGTVTTPLVDAKLVSDDRFDDLTTVDTAGHRVRTQFKHRENAAQPLSLTTFTRDGRDLRLDRLVACAIADRDGPGARAPTASFRLVLRDSRPTDAVLLSVLVPATPDPGPFAPGLPSVRYRFLVDRLWPLQPDSAAPRTALRRFAFLRDGRLQRQDLEWFCGRATVEVEAPGASFDLLSPGPAEILLLDRVRRDIGAEAYPNVHRAAVDVAQALIAAARASRQGTLVPSFTELVRVTQLRHDFGAVARAHPVDSAVEISRRRTVDVIIDSVNAAARAGMTLILQGPPGQGKSWTCHQVRSELLSRGWLIAEHYCFLGNSDSERVERVLGEVICGSLLKQLADQDPDLVASQRPRFAADEDALANALLRARERDPDRSVALIVDGLDHVTRVRGVASGQADPAQVVAEQIAEIELPKGCALVVLSQPGPHLAPLLDTGAMTESLLSMDREELRALATRIGALGQVKDVEANEPGSAPVRPDKDTVEAFLTSLQDRSAGNALYATYLCREVARLPASQIDPSAFINSLPPFDGTLHAYYRHLAGALGDGAMWIAETLALLDFGVTRAELREIRPDFAHRVDVALGHLAPVLVERSSQRGIRIYHESFARFLVAGLSDAPQVARSTLNSVSEWLRRRGFLEDSLAFRFLLPTLSRADRDSDVVELLGPDFAWRAVAAGFMPSAIKSNVAIGIAAAARLNDWPRVVRFVELARAAEAYEWERLDTRLVEFADVPMALLGPEKLAERLLFDGETTVPARAGILLCGAIDKAGGVAPWPEYLNAFRREAAEDNTSYGAESDQAVSLAWIRGRLRTTPGRDDRDQKGAAQAKPRAGGAPDILKRVVRWIAQNEPPATAMANIIGDTLGEECVGSLIDLVGEASAYALAFAERRSLAHDKSGTEDAMKWGRVAASKDPPPGQLHRLLRLGIGESALGHVPDRDGLLSLTNAVLQERIEFEPIAIYRWLDACTLAARSDPLGLAAAEALLAGEGWYRCWLRFVVGLCRAEASSEADASSGAICALNELKGDLRPFVGKPRACDLYQIHEVIASTIRRAISIVNDRDWADAVRILQAVSNGIGVTLNGEMAGPLPKDLLLELIVSATNAVRRSTSATLVREVQQSGSGRYYSDVAAFHLWGARLSIASGDLQSAREAWHTACQLFVAYIWRKDVTIYDLLDPLPALAARDASSARSRVALLQALCERVLEHTDGKDTRHARAQWWKVLAGADPIALARIVAPALLSNCNTPSEMLEGARADLWRAQGSRVDPFLSGVLRLTLPAALVAEDADAVDRLAELGRKSGSTGARRLLTLLLARADERATDYSFSNADELIDRDSKLVERLNAIASRNGLAQVGPLFRKRTPTTPDLNPRSETRYRKGLEQELTWRIASLVVKDFGGGVAGIGRAMRAWRRRPFQATDPHWASSRFANAIGYRLLEAVESGRTQDALFAVRSLAESIEFGEGAVLLSDIASGCDARGLPELAVAAYALTWTRSRAGGGWLTFGGKTALDSLRRAAEIDAGSALAWIAMEVQRAVAGKRGLNGITQAVVYALAEIDFGPGLLGGHSSLDTAFLCWDEAASVIASRLPRLHQNDDPEFPYIPVASEMSGGATGDLEVAIACAAIAGIAHPGREQKRRSLVAISLLAREKPVVAAKALELLLKDISDPLTLSWLLATLLNAGEVRSEIARISEQPLRVLAENPHLTVRALAAELLSSAGFDLPVPPSSTPDPLLLLDDRKIWVPNDAPEVAREDQPSRQGNGERQLSDKAIRELVQGVAGMRLELAEEMAPGLTTAATTRVTSLLRDSAHQRRMQRQLEFLMNRARPHWPDAILDSTETLEGVIQRIAGGARAARALSSGVVTEPRRWEDELAARLLSDPRLPLMLEQVRIPRPPFEPPPAGDVLGDKDNGERKLESGGRTEPLRSANTVRAASEAPTIREGPMSGWRVLAYIEQRVNPAPYLSESQDSTTYIHCGIERREFNSGHADLPLGYGDARVWFNSIRGPPPGHLLAGPLVGVDLDGPVIGHSREGLGLATFAVLAPHPALVLFLGLTPDEEPLELRDSSGSGIALSTWRAMYNVANGELSRPLLCGACIALRPDLFDRILASDATPTWWREFRSDKG